MRSIDADDELFASIAGKLHFKLASFVRLRPCVQFFLSNLIVEPFANPDGSLAHGGMRLGRLNGQEFGKHFSQPAGTASCSPAAPSVPSARMSLDPGRSPAAAQR
ncbi:hypothetical protein, partial [Mesorhizobium sp.]|uniref:hypothetical protein n=1 Tax=Mesorhizobium sp. TaxID=1871066 RepID=UPI0025B87EBB